MGYFFCQKYIRMGVEEKKGAGGGGRGQTENKLMKNIFFKLVKWGREGLKNQEKLVTSFMDGT